MYFSSCCACNVNLDLNGNIVYLAALLQLEGGGALLSSLQALGCSCAIEKQPLPRSVSWMRKTPGAQVIT